MADPLERLAAALADRYRIERELGTGGMATVYQAEDLKHHRKVAVKVFRPELARSLGTERFLREIQLAAQLHHPHIIALHDSGEAAGFLYYLMPLVDGETLRARLRREGPLPIDAALHIAREVADALGYAHHKGVIHRDIKPENILLADGHAFVADFGIARALDTAAEQLTQTGFALGTPAYMAPEQAVGEKEVDGRADLYALGCVLYEMLTGATPYQGPTQQAILVKQFTELVPAVRTRRAEVPEWLDRLVAQTLARDPAGRPADAQALTKALAGSTIGAAGGAIRPVGDSEPSIAVLPFANMSADPENEYFSDGISEELINALTQFPNLKVIARTSAFSFKGKNVDIREIGRALGVKTVLEGSVRKAGNRIRITAQLIDVTDGSHKWSQRYEREMKDVFAVQDEITDAIRQAVGARLLGGATRPRVRQETDPDTYGIYLKGRHALARLASQGNEAIGLLEEVIRRDPSFAPAHAALALALAGLNSYGLVPSREAFPKVKAAADRALALAPDLGSAHAALAAHALLYAWDWPAAAHHAERAVELEPGEASGYLWGAFVWISQGAFERGIEWAARATRIDPLSPSVFVWAGIVRFLGRRFDEAAAASREALRLDPAYWDAKRVLGHAELYAGRSEAAEAILRVALKESDRYHWVVFLLAVVRLVRGDTASARALTSELTSRRAAGEAFPALALMYVNVLTDPDAAFAWAERAAEERHHLLTMLRVDPMVDPIRDDPRFEALCRKVGIPELPPEAKALSRIRWWENQAAPAADRSIVVLPFENASPDPDNAYFADGLTEELIADLSKIRELKVIARNSAMRLKGTTKDAPTLGRELKVRYVLGGSVRKAGSSLRITAQLSDAKDDSQVWAEKYVGTTNEVFDLQERLSRQIVAALKLTLTTDEQSALSDRPIKDPVAYELYLKARLEFNKTTKPGLDRAVMFLRQAEAVEGPNLRILTMLVWTYCWYRNMGWETPLDAVALAREVLSRAVALDPASLEIQLARGVLAMVNNELLDAVHGTSRVLAAVPNQTDALALWAIVVAQALGQPDRCRPRVATLMELDPLSYGAHGALVVMEMMAGRYQEALAAAEAGLRFEPENFDLRFYLGWTLTLCGQAGRGAAVYRELEQEARNWSAGTADCCRLCACGAEGNAEGVAASSTPALRSFLDTTFVTWALPVVEAHAMVGLEDEAMDWLDHMFAKGYADYPHLTRDPLLANLRGFPRFEQFLPVAKARWEAVARQLENLPPL